MKEQIVRKHNLTIKTGRLWAATESKNGRQ
jgi:hypothetical protein